MADSDGCSGCWMGMVEVWRGFGSKRREFSVDEIEPMRRDVRSDKRYSPAGDMMLDPVSGTSQLTSIGATCSTGRVDATCGQG